MSSTQSPYVKSALRGFSAYVPGEQPQPDPNLIKLNTNENPYPVAPGVLEVLHHLSSDSLRRYSDPNQVRLRETAAKVMKVNPEHLIAGNGSDELLAMILRAFLDPGELVAYPCPTYSLYPTLTRMYGGQTVECPAPLGAPKIAPVLSIQAKITFIAAPNSPDGYLVERDEISRLCEARQGIGIVVVDEAYVDFSQGGATGLIKHYDNLIITRTLSKSYSLAGLRVGLAAACKPLMDALWAVKDSYNLGTVPQALAGAALEDQEWMQRNANRIIATRENTTQELVQRGWYVYPSQANFIFTEPPAGRSAQELYQHLAEQQIYVRYFPSPPLDKGLRISIGSDAEMQTLLAVLKEIEA
jgi:histidinol-phosphate aminotransferase